MKAMVLAAGLGTRLRPLTNDRPKALVTIAGRTMLEIVLVRLRDFGVHEVIVNTHHFADMIRDYLEANGNFGMRIEISHEEELLDTGGGLKKAAWFFLDGKNPDDPSLAPFILHNVDIVSTIDIAGMMRAHKDKRRAGNDCGAGSEDKALPALRCASGPAHAGGIRGHDGQPEMASALAMRRCARIFVHSGDLSQSSFREMTETGAFSIIDTELRLASQGEKILSFRADGAYWRDLGGRRVWRRQRKS